MTTQKLKGGEKPEDIGQKLQTLWFGAPGSGKTSLLLSYPSPITFVNLDRDPSELIAMMPEEVEIYYLRIPYDMETTPAIANKVLNDIDVAARKAIATSKQTGRGSFVLDGFDLLWDYVKIAKLPHAAADQNLAREYGDANAWMHGFLSRLYFSPLQVGLSAMSKEIWKGQSTGSGTFDPDGFRHRGRWLTHEVYLFVPEETAPKERPVRTATTGQSHVAYIRVSKVNEKALVRMVVPNLSFKTLFKLSYGSVYDGPTWSPSSIGAEVPVAEPESS